VSEWPAWALFVLETLYTNLPLALRQGIAVCFEMARIWPLIGM
jgi:hypothetical protein